ncbi:MAG: extracellular solute-binding protein [Treponema sp.]|jgi:putative aldouronate transport system substrate-binding protein|nr:extracellular solute-binding protein [Treponema sp.]
MSKKQFEVLVFCFTLTAGILSAGGAQSSDGGSSSANSENPMAITMATMTYRPLEEHAKMIEMWNKMFNVDIQVWPMEAANYAEMLNLRFAANEIPDFFLQNLSSLNRYYEQQVLAEIPEDLIKQYLPIPYREYEEQYPGFLNLTKKNGKIYGILAEMDTPYRTPIVYRGDWIKNVGKSGAPKTLAEFEELIYLFTKNDPDKNGRKDTYGLSSTAMMPVYGAFGYVRSQWVEKNGQLVYSSIQPEMKEALSLLAKWYKDGVIDPEFITGENKGGYWAVSHAFTEGRIGVSSHASFYHWDAPDPNRANINEMAATNPEGAASTFFGAPFSGPAGKKGVSMRMPMTEATLFFGTQLEKDRSKMIKILQMQNYFVENADNYITAFYGVRGVDWDYDANNSIKQTNEDQLYCWAVGGGLISRKFVTPSGEAARNSSYAKFCPANGFYTDGYQNQLIVPLPSSGIYQTEINKIEDETYIAIISGERPVSYFDTFVAQWKAKGGDVLTKEANDWWKTVK